MERIRTAVAGCTGIVGQQFIGMLDDHPFFEVVAITASKKSAGARYGDAAAWALENRPPGWAEDMTISETLPDKLADLGVRVVFSALPSSAAESLEPALAGRGLFVFSNAGVHRRNPAVPILIPEVNPGHLELARSRAAQEDGFIIANSNCSTTGLVMALKPLTQFGLKSITVSTYQAVSGAGRHGISGLDVLDNVLPHIPDEEDKIEWETNKILGNYQDGRIRNSFLEINASCCRVPVKNGHLENVVIETNEPIDPELIFRAMDSFRGRPQELKLPTAPDAPLIIRKDENRPQPTLDARAGAPERARGMAVTIGRVRQKRQKINFTLLVHNTIRGAAGTCILNAELASCEGYLNT